MVRRSVLFVVLGLFLFAGLAYAHEVYVLDEGTVRASYGVQGINVFSALDDPDSARFFWSGFATIAVVFALLLYLLHTKLSKHMDMRFSVLRKYAHLVIRVGLGTSLAWGAWNDAVFGPEIALAGIPGGVLWKPILFAAGLLLIVGAFTRIVAAISLLLFAVLLLDHGAYMMNYFDYLGEMIILLLERGEVLSLDKWIRWKSHIFHRRLPHWLDKLEDFSQKYSFTIIRVTFGIALIWAAVSVKIFYPALSLEVLRQYGLDLKAGLPALLIVLGAAITEIWIGIALIIGVLYRFHLLVLLTFTSVSVWFFGETVWPHIVILSAAIGLFLHGKDKYMIDDRLYAALWGWTRRFRKSKNPLSPE